MKIQGRPFRTIWKHPDEAGVVQVIDQRPLPHRLVIEDLHSLEEVVTAIADMHVRGAPLIGVAAAFGIYLACHAIVRGERDAAWLAEAAATLKAARPTAVNLAWAVDTMMTRLSGIADAATRASRALAEAEAMAEEEVERCRLIGVAGLPLIEAIAARRQGPVNVLTHCNAGWLACIDWGTVTSPIYQAAAKGIPVHVWVDETRPRNQGATLTAYELLENGIPHTVIADNTGGHLMQHGMVDIVIVGADRVTRNGDAANKIGTYLKALAAHDNGVPFYVAVPGSSFDLSIADGLKEIEIEARSPDEVRYVQGLCEGEIKSVLITPRESSACNFGFDVTPARLITGLITERGICEASPEGIRRLFP